MSGYKFGDYFFSENNRLTKKGRMVKIPPKETGVLRLLLENAGDVVTKETIINKIWHGGIVSDESLTRCLYMLRKRLGENEQVKFIETVYGKGYCFIYPLQTTLSNESSPHEKGSDPLRVALFPFVLHDRELALKIHDQLCEKLYMVNEKGINIMPSFFTRHCEDYQSVLDLLERTPGDYYIVGTQCAREGQCIIRLELIDSVKHILLKRESAVLTGVFDSDCESLRLAIIRLLIYIKPELKNLRSPKKLPFDSQNLFSLKVKEELFK
ncbi:winged helix-turn-helix domain-containing protein [[Erwinia] mediterraneensis]|uniref:winged helix-turn-helix domain-containing protein n=1 Tax=[Erwinia] mediterraneensis TaxID=2161819 RepID=UPI00102F7F60|nr:winged helix-turn-helix domain-containing protein [[Erwinia] mediterraneensis]